MVSASASCPPPASVQFCAGRRLHSLESSFWAVAPSGSPQDSSHRQQAAACVDLSLVPLGTVTALASHGNEGSSGEGRALPAAMRAATRHAPFLLRQLAHFSSFGASRGHVPSFLAASLRFIGAKRPFAPRGHLHTAQLRTQGITEVGGK